MLDDHPVKTVTVLPAGSWGTALAILAAANTEQVFLWHRCPDKAADLQHQRQNTRRLAGVVFPDNITVTPDLPAALQASEAVILAPPSHAFEGLCRDIAPWVSDGQAYVLSATKGLDPKKYMRMSQLAASVLPPCILGPAVLAGPTFAREAAVGQPTSALVAADHSQVIRTFQTILHGPTFRIYSSQDMIGAEIGGAVKNVLAIGVGIAVGMGLGYNAVAALITRGLNEMVRLGTSLGAQPVTFAGLAGLGDLVLTCTGELSRNRQAGIELGRGRELKDILPRIGTVEGIGATAAVHNLAAQMNLEMPITAQIYAVLFNGKTPAAAVRELMARDHRPEMDAKPKPDHDLWTEAQPGDID
ncbi:MAG: NAD(P)H-dependent glycerol-3-phosphate dehydrogenase [Thermaerobacterales bacterium]